MSETADSEVLGHLRDIRTRVDSIDGRVGRLTNRVGAVEHYLNGLRQDFARFGARHVNVQAEIDALVRRVEAIERRLEISDQT